MAADKIRSMTGFGSATRDSDGVRATIELRSVNHRFLKVSVHAAQVDGPALPAAIIHRLEERLRKHCGRGSLTVVVRLEAIGPEARRVVDVERLRAVFDDVRAARDRLLDSSELSDARVFELALSAPGVLGSESSSPADLEAIIDAAMTDALQGLDAMQRHEGDALAEELGTLLADVDRSLAIVESDLPAIAAENRDRYRARVRELLRDTGVEVTDADLLRELAILAEKADVTEEVGRLRGHLVQYREVLGGGGQVGRQLDFLTQEMFREANTMAAKVNRQSIAATVVEAKAGIDRLREQTQNIA